MDVDQKLKMAKFLALSFLFIFSSMGQTEPVAAYYCSGADETIEYRGKSWSSFKSCLDGAPENVRSGVLEAVDKLKSYLGRNLDSTPIRIESHRTMYHFENPTFGMVKVVSGNGESLNSYTGYYHEQATKEAITLAFMVNYIAFNSNKQTNIDTAQIGNAMIREGWAATLALLAKEAGQSQEVSSYIFPLSWMGQAILDKENSYPFVRIFNYLRKVSPKLETIDLIGLSRALLERTAEIGYTSENERMKSQDI